MDIVGTLLLASGAMIACGAVVAFSRARPDAGTMPIVHLVQVWRHNGHTPAGQRLLAWLNFAVSLQLLGVAALLWFLLEG